MDVIQKADLFSVAPPTWDCKKRKYSGVDLHCPSTQSIAMIVADGAALEDMIAAFFVA